MEKKFTISIESNSDLDPLTVNLSENFFLIVEESIAGIRLVVGDVF